MAKSEHDAAELYEALRVHADLAVRMQARLAAAAGLAVTDISAIGTLEKRGPMTPGELAAYLGMSRGGAITTLIDRLEKAGMVQRRRDTVDRRKVLVEIVSGEAHQTMAQLLEKLRADYFKVFAAASLQEQRNTHSMIKKLNEILEERLDL